MSNQLSPIKKVLANHWVLLAIRLILGGIFLYAGFVKIQAPLAFADSIASFRLLPDSIINLFALGLPPIEIIVGAMLLIGWRIRLASFAVLILSFMFALALGQALLRGLDVDCGCFGSGKPSLEKSLFSLARDLLLIGAGALVYARSYASAKSSSRVISD